MHILFAAGDPPWLIPVMCVVVMSAMVALILGIVGFTRYVFRKATEALKRAYDGIETRHKPRTRDVEIRFHTYYGLLGSGYQNHHHVFLKPSDAALLLKRLHGFNLRWGLLCPSALFVPFLSFASYWKQLKSIKSQTRAA